MKLYVSHSSNFDYVTELYEPLKRDLQQKHEIYFPHDSENINDKSINVIAESNFIVAEVSYPSTGQGIELGWADAQNIPIICIYRKGRSFSKSLKFICSDFIEYENPSEIGIKLETLFGVKQKASNP